MAKPLTRTQLLQNRAFLKALRRTGNVRLACREVGLKYGTMQHRRRVHRAFACSWDAELVCAQARLARGGLPRFARNDGGPSTASGPLQMQERKGPSTIHSEVNGPPPRASSGRSWGHRTLGGEPVIVRLKSGKLQVRRAQRGRLTRAAEQAFLAALSATCNISLAAAAVGSCCRAFRRRRQKDPAFAREMRMALRQGYETLELSLVESMMPGAREHEDWRSNAPPAMPPMNPSEALQLMYLHQKEARLIAEPDWLKRRRGESHAAHCERLTAMAEERDRLAREEFAVAEALRMERGEPAWGPAGEMVRRGLRRGRAPRGVNPRDVDPVGLQPLVGRPLAGSSTEARLCNAKPPFCSAAHGLPDLAQVTGWSRARAGGSRYGPGALFGGWRIAEMEEKLRRR